MKNMLMTAAGTCLLVIGLTASTQASASCQNICVRVYRACIAQGIQTVEACEVQENQCFAQCGSRRITSLMDEKGSAAKQEEKPVCDQKAPLQETSLTRRLKVG